jgi:hypothetical protein
MKHLKKYETVIFENEQIKRYTIWEFPTNLVIMETLNISPFISTFKRIYIYYNDSRLQRSDNQQFKIENPKNKRVIFTSDDLQETLDILPTIRYSNKYNI